MGRVRSSIALLLAVLAADVVADLRLVLGNDDAGPLTRRALTWPRELVDTHEALIPLMGAVID